MNTRKIAIFDTTLRDGEQSPGCSMKLHDKLLVAGNLEQLRVDVIEAGFAIASPGDFESVRTVAEHIKDCTVASLARCLKGDIDQAWAAVQIAVRPRIHTFLATSPVHMQYKLRMSPEQVYDQAVSMVKYARSLCPDVQFSLEDYTRTEEEFSWKVIEGVIKAGATVVNLPDTVGYAIPEEFGRRIARVLEHVPNAGDAVLAVHCHNDLGLGVANTLAALRAGAGQAECTVNGIGERAGNAALEEIVMAIKTRRDYFAGLECGIDTTKIINTSRCVCSVTGSRIQANKAIVGQNAFAHESGIHQHGMMANKETYEIMTPESIGLTQSQMVLGKHSGRHALEAHLGQLGIKLSDNHLQELFLRFKDLADAKKVVTDADIEALARGLEMRSETQQKLVFDRFLVSTGNTSTNMSSVRLKVDGQSVEEVAVGSGPIEASFNAINKMLNLHVTVENFSVSAVTANVDAQGECDLRIRHNQKVYLGRGVAQDIIEASIRAYVHALNGLLDDEQRMTVNSATMAAAATGTSLV
ncbi:MAG: 2-isopropylmalate synthase [Kiritimatiellia bacterium]